MPAIGTGLPRSAWSLIRTALRPSPWRSWSPTLSPRRRSALWTLLSAVPEQSRQREAQSCRGSPAGSHPHRTTVTIRTGLSCRPSGTS